MIRIDMMTNDQCDVTIKRLMEQVGYPNSRSHYQAFKQFQNEMCQSIQVITVTGSRLVDLGGNVYAAEPIPESRPRSKWMSPTAMILWFAAISAVVCLCTVLYYYTKEKHRMIAQWKVDHHCVRVNYNVTGQAVLHCDGNQPYTEYDIYKEVRNGS